MNKILDMMERELKRAFTASGYEDSFAKVVLSNRPDCVSTSATVPWQRLRHIRKSPSI